MASVSKAMVSASRVLVITCSNSPLDPGPVFVITGRIDGNRQGVVSSVAVVVTIENASDGGTIDNSIVAVSYINSETASVYG